MKPQEPSKNLSPAVGLQELAQANANVAKALADVAAAIRELQQLAEDALPDSLYNQVVKKRTFRRQGSQIRAKESEKGEAERKARSEMERLHFPDKASDPARDYLASKKMSIKGAGTVKRHIIEVLVNREKASNPSLSLEQAKIEAKAKWEGLFDPKQGCFVLNTQLLDEANKRRKEKHAFVQASLRENAAK